MSPRAMERRAGPEPAASLPDDDELLSTIEACRQGSREAFGRLFEAIGPRMFALARSLSRDDPAAEEICQLVFVKLFSAIEKFRGESRFETWLFRIVVNASRDEGRRRRRVGALEEIAAEVQEPPSAFPDRDFARRQEAEMLWNAVAGLPPKLREPIVLRYREDFSYDEIGAVLGCSAGTVASRLHRGHRMLARRLSSLGPRKE